LHSDFFDATRESSASRRRPLAPEQENGQRLAGYAELGIMQSIFSPAARREGLREREYAERRDGELKMDWTKPPEDSRAYGY